MGDAEKQKLWLSLRIMAGELVAKDLSGEELESLGHDTYLIDHGVGFPSKREIRLSAAKAIYTAITGLCEPEDDGR